MNVKVKGLREKHFFNRLKTRDFRFLGMSVSDLACPAGLSVLGSKGSAGAAESGCAPLQ
jgi:hypothetical protein